MADPRIEAARQQMLKEGFPPEEIERAFQDLSSLTKQQTATPPSFFSRFTTLLSESKTNIPQRVKADLLKAGWPEERAKAQAQKTASQLQAVPETGTELARMVIPFLVGRAVPAGRTIPRVLGQLFGNIGGSAALEGIQASIKSEDIPSAVIEGAVKGTPAGVLQATTGAVLGPTKATIKAQKSLEGLLQAFSPEVAKVLGSKTQVQLNKLLSRETTIAMEKAAGKSLDLMEADLSKQLFNQRFEFPTGAGPKSLIVTPGGPAKSFSLKVPFEDIRAEIKRIRNIGEAAFADPAKQFKAKQRAAQIEQHLLSQLPPELANQYQQTIQRYATDRAIIRSLKAIQRAQALPGGLNRADSPIVATAMDLLQDPGLSTEGRAAAMAALALSGHPFMALHFSGFGRKSGVLDPKKIKPPLGGPQAGLFGAAVGALGAAGTEAITP